MARERFIRGKQDDAKHVGKYHNVKAEQAAQHHLDEELNKLPKLPAKIPPKIKQETSPTLTD